MSAAVCPTCGQQIQATERRVRDAIRSALDEVGMTQAELASRVGVTQKHISQVLSGKAGLSFDFAERLLGVLGRRLEATVAPIADVLPASTSAVAPPSGDEINK